MIVTKNKIYIFHSVFFQLFFSGFRPLNGNLKEYEANKFIHYSMYAWGCPTLITLFTYCKEIWPDILLPNLIKPEWNERTCWFLCKYIIYKYKF